MTKIGTRITTVIKMYYNRIVARLINTGKKCNHCFKNSCKKFVQKFADYFASKILGVRDFPK